MLMELIQENKGLVIGGVAVAGAAAAGYYFGKKAANKAAQEKIDGMNAIIMDSTTSNEEKNKRLAEFLAKKK